MVNKRYIRGIAFVVLMMSVVLIAMAATPVITNPTTNPETVTNTVGESRTFSITVNQTMNVSWYINGTTAQPTNLSVTTASYTNTSAALGTWNISAIAENGNGTVMQVWYWTVTAPAPSETAPQITSPTAINITDTSADISFTVNQSDANTTVRYGTTESSLTSESIWSNGTGSSRTIQLSGLTKSTTYYYSVYAYNGSNQSYFSNSSIQNFATNNPSAPNITNVATGNLSVSSVNISFDVNQSNAKTRVYYGTTEALGAWSDWNNISSLSRTIMLSGLSEGTLYYYSVYAYNGSNQSYFTNYSIQNLTTVAPVAPNITNITAVTPTASSVNISFDVNQSNAKTRIYYGTTETLGTWSDWNNISSLSRTIMLSILNNGTKYYYSVYAYNGSNQSYSSNSSIYNFTTKYPAPKVLSPSPNTPWQTIGSQSVNFTVSFDQTVNVIWYINGTNVSSNTSVTSAYYLNNSPSTGTWNITVVGSNANGTASYKWLWTVRPRSYETGNRIWDSTKEMNLTYTWNPMSFYAFYYDVDNNVGNESLKIILDSNTDRNIQENTLVYSTAPENVSFKYKKWGFYNVVGFMAEKYFAAYTAGTSTEITGGSPKSTIGSKQLHKILMDDDTSRAVYAGSTLTLSEGYVLKIKDVDITGNKVVNVQLLKDGGEVDTNFIEAGKTYIYSKRVGTVSDLPI
ncbi:MAG: S-layer protein domain-containing protein, partial [Candidatus Methanoperedens sp.]|nr:S-layer protein domain-containing protein [Candidatus Methanoperedens sp.]